MHTDHADRSNMPQLGSFIPGDSTLCQVDKKLIKTEKREVGGGRKVKERKEKRKLEREEGKKGGGEGKRQKM